MPSNNTGFRAGELCGRFPEQFGHLFSPGGQRGPYCRYGLDNGAFGAGENWTEGPWLKLMEWARMSGRDPLWCLVPDVVGSRDGTLQRWEQYFPIAEVYGWPLAFAVQDGMTIVDVPSNAEVVFVGGSTEWKWSTYKVWCAAFPRVHIGRVNSYTRLWQCHEAGAESTDGTGWFRGDKKQEAGLVDYFEESSGKRHRVVNSELFGGINAIRVS